MYQARLCDFEAELTAAEGVGLNVGAEVFDRSNVDPVRFRNADVAWMTLIKNCKGMALEIVQRSEAPNDAWRNLESHYIAKGAREIFRLSHEVNGKAMQPGEGPFKFMMKIDRLKADHHRLGDKSVTELKKCVVIVAGLSADYHIECRIPENNPTGLERAEIGRVVGSRRKRLLRQQQDRREKNRRSRNRFEGNCFICGRKGNRAEECKTAKKIEKSGDAATDKQGGGRGKCYVCRNEEHFALKHCSLCRSLEHRTRDCEEREAEKGAMLAKMNVLANSEGDWWHQR